MKKLIYLLAFAITASTSLSSCSDKSGGKEQGPKLYVKYFFESGDTVLGSVFVMGSASLGDLTLDFDEGPNTQRTEPGIEYKRLHPIISNDSILIPIEHKDKYGEDVLDSLILVTTFNDEGILETKDLIKFVNSREMVKCNFSERAIPKVDKVTIKER